MKFKLYDKNINKQELSFIMTCLQITCGCCLVIGFLGNINLYYELGKDATENYMWKKLPECITLLIMALCSIFVMLIARNVILNEVFTHNNAVFIMGIGTAILMNGFILGLLPTFTPVERIGQGYMIYILIGALFLFIACVFKLGIKMKEEQELTI